MANYLLVFLAMTALDFVYAEYTRAVAKGRIVWASTTAAILIALGGFVTSSYVKDHTLLCSAVVGAFAGTWLSMYVERRRGCG